MNAQETLARGIGFCEQHMECTVCPLNNKMCINNEGKLMVQTHDFLQFTKDFSDMIKEIYK